MSYGWRKDMTVFHVLSAIKSLASPRPDLALRWLNQLSPAIAIIDEITDGDETNHAKPEMAELYFELHPSTYVAYYRHLLLSSEWRDAERVFSTFAELEPLQPLVARTALSCIWGNLEVDPLRQRKGSEASSATDLVAKSEIYFGFQTGELGRGRDQASSSDAIRDVAPFDPTAFGPHELSRLIGALRAAHIYVGETIAVKSWFDHWISSGRATDVLSAVDGALQDTVVSSGLEGILDDVFDQSLRLQGRDAAYRWIVEAHIRKHGWSDFWSKQSAVARIGLVATHYPKRWKQFVTDTSRSPFSHSEERLVIPHHRLVQLLVLLGEVGYAAEIVDEMVSAVVRELSGQPIGQPDWIRD
jgi:hypothetical protein